jgi:hypothetical protein
MLGNVFTQTYYLPGTLAANVDIRFKPAINCKLIHVSACGSNTNNAVMVIGSDSDNDAYLTAVDVGDGNVPSEFDRDDFVNTQYPRLSKSGVVSVLVDYDGAGGTAVANLSLVLTFLEG